MSTELRVDRLRKGRNFTADQKLAILREWEKDGNGVVVVEKYRVYPQTVVSVEEVFGGGSKRIASGSASEEKRRTEAIKGREAEVKRGSGFAESGVNAFKIEMNLV